MPCLNLQNVPQIKKLPGYLARFVHSANMTFAHWEIEAGVPLPEHSHPHEQVAHVLEGTFELTIEGDTHNLVPGDVAIIPGGAKHSGKALTACRILDVFYPIREEYR